LANATGRGVTGRLAAVSVQRAIVAAISSGQPGVWRTIVMLAAPVIVSTAAWQFGQRNMSTVVGVARIMGSFSEAGASGR
jgi:hypothetical protein